MSASLRIIKFLRDNPGWHRGRDIARVCKVWRATVYIHLANIVDAELAERRDIVRPGRRLPERIEFRGTITVCNEANCGPSPYSDETPP